MDNPIIALCIESYRAAYAVLAVTAESDNKIDWEIKLTVRKIYRPGHTRQIHDDYAVKSIVCAQDSHHIIVCNEDTISRYMTSTAQFGHAQDVACHNGRYLTKPTRWR